MNFTQVQLNAIATSQQLSLLPPTLQLNSEGQLTRIGSNNFGYDVITFGSCSTCSYPEGFSSPDAIYFGQGNWNGPQGMAWPSRLFINVIWPLEFTRKTSNPIFYWHRSPFLKARLSPCKETSPVWEWMSATLFSISTLRIMWDPMSQEHLNWTEAQAESWEVLCFCQKVIYFCTRVSKFYLYIYLIVRRYRWWKSWWICWPNCCKQLSLELQWHWYPWLSSNWWQLSDDRCVLACLFRR